MITAHVASFWNYRLMFDVSTFHLRDISTADWNRDPYFVERLSNRDMFLNMDWTTLLKWALPIIWVLLFLCQIYNTWTQFRIGLYESRRTDEKNHVKPDTDAKLFDAVVPPRLLGTTCGKNYITTYSDAKLFDSVVSVQIEKGWQDKAQAAPDLEKGKQDEATCSRSKE